MRAPTVLMTYFEPFDGQPINASAEAVRAVNAQSLPDGVSLVRAELPCVFGKSIDVLRALIHEHAPDLVICVGQAGGRAGVSIERVAINVSDARIADNVGAQPIDVPIVKDGPVAYWSSLPIKAIARAVHAQRIAVEISQTAGTYVCNHVFYGLMHALASAPHVRGGFVHIPFLPEQASNGAPSLPLTTQARALEIIATTALQTKADVAETGGATH